MNTIERVSSAGNGCVRPAALVRCKNAVGDGSWKEERRRAAGEKIHN